VASPDPGPATRLLREDRDTPIPLLEQHVVPDSVEIQVDRCTAATQVETRVPAPSQHRNRQNDNRRVAAIAHIQRFDHIGITVADLDSVTAFFVGLGLELEGTGSVQGEFVETVCGIVGAHCEIAMLRPPDGGCRLELTSFITPDHVPGPPTAMANELGLRNVSFMVGDLEAAVDAVAADGYGLVGGIGEYENSVRMAYVRGPEGIIVSLFEQIG
jgi:catechol 2,3-dioxygenase-like lactoylglutathione lyase family enzyme